VKIGGQTERSPAPRAYGQFIGALVTLISIVLTVITVAVQLAMQRAGPT
jgi:hypothetical protein